MDQASNTLVGRRRPDMPIGGDPYKDDCQPGDYWKVLKHDGSRPVDVHNSDDHYWGSGSEALLHYDQNLTGTVWGVIDPNGNFGMLSIHTVREEDDGTISVRPGDGSSNSILIGSPTPDGMPQYHGYIEHGVWSAC